MGLDFSKTKQMSGGANSSAAEEKYDVEVVESYDIVSDRQTMNTQLTGSPEVDAIVSTIEIDNLETIVSFGADAAEEISKASDVVLSGMNMSQLDDSSEMLNTLAKIMNRFDIEEIKDTRDCLANCLAICGDSLTKYWPNITVWARKWIKFMYS